MREQGLKDAIRAAGGVRALAQKIGISQPSVSNWTRVPADRITAVEAVTGVSREVLRPDLFGSRAEPTEIIDETDAARAREYALLAVLLARAPDAKLLTRLAGLRADPTPLGLAHAGLGEAAAAARPEKIAREFFNLFIGVGRGEVLPYGSYYMSGFLYERPLARLREFLARIGIERAEGQAEPEDHAAILCEIMAGLADRRLAAPADAERELFEKHMAPWMGRLFADLERASEADFYRSVGTLGRIFMEIESEAFALDAPEAPRRERHA
jgi:TorA maturation chaperone TorD